MIRKYLHPYLFYKRIVHHPLMNHRVAKMFVGLSLGFVVAVLIAFNILLLWVATGPRSLEALTPYIEKTFESSDQSYSVLIGETWLIWDGWRHPIDIRLRDIKVQAKGHRFSTFPEVSLGVDVWSLPFGRLLPTSLTVTHPVISLYQNDDRSVSFGFRKEDASNAEPNAAEDITAVPFAAVLAPLLAPDEGGSLRKLRQITILGADVSVGNLRKGVFFKANDTDIIFRRNRQGLIQAIGSAKIRYEQYESFINAQLMMEKDNATIDGEIAFDQLRPSVLSRLLYDDDVLAAMKFPISGKGKLAMDTNGNLQRLGFMLEAGKGSIEYSRLDGVIPVTSMHVEGEITNNANDIQVSQFTANLGGMLAAAEGAVSRKEGDAAIRLNGVIKNVKASDVHLLWPPGLSPQSREWITTNILEGLVSQAQARINIQHGDIAKPVLPKESVDASIALEGAKIRYLPDHPEVHNVKGVVHVDGVSLSADIAAGDYLKETKLLDGKLLIEDLNADNPYIKLNFNAETSAKDVVHILGLPRLKHAERLNLREDAASGSVKGSAALGFNFFAPRDAKGKVIAEPDVAYDITAHLKDVTHAGFMQKFDIKNGDGTMTVKNSGLEFKGTGEVNGASVSASDIKYLFTPDKGLDTFIDVTATAPVESLPRFGYPKFPFLAGKLGIKANVKQGAEEEFSEATIDLVNATVNLTHLNWNKPDKEPATLTLVAEKKDGIVRVPAFHLKGNDTDVKGVGELNHALTDIQKITSENLHYGVTDLDSVYYELIDGGFKLEARGKSADVSGWVENKEESTFSFERFPAVQIKADVAQLYLGKDRQLANVKAEVACDIKLCSSANVSGTTVDKKPFNARILRNPKGKRQFSLQAESAGAFLKAANIFDGMEGGGLTITGNYDDNGKLKGRVDISQHTVKNAPVLAKILSLASLTGFFDTLQGNGITFVKTVFPFTVAKDVITIEKGKTHGAAIGITVDGTITFPKRTLDLEGTVIPSYTLNNVLGKVPLVGQVLTGGEGQGVFAARYNVKGSGQNPDVSVNPLSMLTPGFLRGVFDILDTPKKKSEDAEE